jgi:arginine decarboxylase-like protein
MNHNLLGSANEAHFLIDDTGRAHIEKVVRGETLCQVLDTAGYDTQDLTDDFRNLVQDSEAKSRISKEERDSFLESYLNTLNSYTYLED